jgi:hypothetical protein
MEQNMEPRIGVEAYFTLPVSARLQSFKAKRLASISQGGEHKPALSPLRKAVRACSLFCIEPRFVYCIEPRFVYCIVPRFVILNEVKDPRISLASRHSTPLVKIL